MPGWLQSLFDFFGRFRVCYTVMPWEQGIRVRLGSRVRLVEKGFHWKLPFLDRVFVQNVRLHVVSTCSQTLQGQDGKAVAVVACIGFSIRDILTVYRSVQHIDEALYSWASAAIAERLRPGLSRGEVEDEVADALREKAEEWGLAIEFFRLTDYASVRAFRLLQGDRWSRSNIDLDRSSR